MKTKHAFIAAHARSCFFEKTVLQRKFGDQLLHVAHLLAQAFNLARGRLAPGVAGEPLLARFQKLFRPAVIRTLGDAPRRHKAAMLSSPRRPDTTIRIFSSGVYCLRVLRRISRTVLSAGSFLPIDFCLVL